MSSSTPPPDTAAKPHLVLCTRCHRWLIDVNKDRYCSGCGLTVSGLTIEYRGRRYPASQQLLYYYTARERAKGQVSLNLQLKHCGVLASQIQEVLCPAEMTYRLAPEGKLSLTLNLAQLLSTQDSCTLSCTLNMENGQREHLTLGLYPLPSLDHFQVRKVNFLRLHDQAEEITLLLSFGRVPVLLEKVQLTDSEGQVAPSEIALQAPTGSMVPVGQQLALTLVKQRHWQRHEQHRYQITLYLHFLEQEVLVPVQVTQKRGDGLVITPPELMIEAITPGFAEQRPLMITNESDFEIRVQELRPSAPWISLRDCPPSFVLAPGAHRMLQVVVDVEASPESGKAGLTGTITYRTDLVAQLQGEFPVLIGRISPVEELSSHLAIDFGTSNTCCALREGMRFVCLEIGEPPEPTVVPSVIYFQDVSEPQHPDYLIGKAAQKQVMIGRKSAFVQSIKRRLGSHEHIQIIDPQGQHASYRPEEICAFFLKAVIERAEHAISQQLKRKVRIDKVVSTYPVAFSRQQVELLRRIYLEKTGVKDLICDLDEATAGALNFLTRWRPEPSQRLENSNAREVIHELTGAQQTTANELANANEGSKTNNVSGVSANPADVFPPDSDTSNRSRIATGSARTAVEESCVQTLLIYDFGGGTIDICLIKLSWQKRGGHTILRPEPIGITGLYRFGGEDITRLIRDLIVTKIQKQGTQRGLDIRIPVGQAARRPQEYSQIKHNNHALYDLATQVKLALFPAVQPTDEETVVTIDDEHLAFNVQAQVNGQWRSASTLSELFAGAARRGSVVVTISQREVYEQITPEIERSVERAYRLWHYTRMRNPTLPPQIDRVLLIGRSAGIPLIRQLFMQKFGLQETAITFDYSTAKQIVAQGACFHAANQRGAFLTLSLDTGKICDKILIPLGYAKGMYGESFEPVFLNGESVPARKQIFLTNVSGTTLFLRFFQNLDYTDIMSPEADPEGKIEVGYFRIDKKHPIFHSLGPDDWLRLPLTLEISQAPDTGLQLDAVYTNAAGQSQRFSLEFDSRFLAVVDEES